MAGSLSDWLFQGRPPTTTSKVKSQGPLWLQQALSGAISAATQLAGQPYQAFPGPTVATPSADTTGAWDLARSNVGVAKPSLDEAANYLTEAGAPVDAASIQEFLNPYQDYVTGALNRNLTEKLLPSIQDKFVSSGQSRSPQEQEITSRALRDTQTSVGESMAGAYQNAVNSLLQRRANLGTLGAETGTIGALRQQVGAGDVASLAGAGAGRDTVAQANLSAAQNRFQAEQQWPYQNLGFLSNIIHGLPVQSAGTTTTTTGTNYPQMPSALQAYNTAANAYSGMGYRKGGPVRGALSRSGRAAPHYALAA